MTWELILLIAIVGILGLIFTWASSMREVVTCHLEVLEARIGGLTRELSALRLSIEEQSKTPIFEGERSSDSAKIIDPLADPKAEFGDEKDDWFD